MADMADKSNQEARLPRRNIEARDDSWKDHGRCRGVSPGLFYPDNSDSASIAAAKAVCADCPVRDACLESALINNEQGIWGATDERERRRIIRARGTSTAGTTALTATVDPVE
jgi:WhiB family transcriptional regulator, redox-sensing transcriptional regulator